MSFLQNTLDEFHVAATSANLDYFIIGGFAASYWGKPRFTADIDFVIEISNLEKAKNILFRLGYELSFLHPKQSFAHFSKKTQAAFRIDFMLVNNETWLKLSSDAKLVDFGNSKKYPLVSAMHLIAMKLHAVKQDDRQDKYKDLNDIAEIMNAQRITFEELMNSDIIDKYGTEESIKKLREIYSSKL